MKPYQILDCDCLETIQNETVQFVTQHYNDIWTRPGLWHKIDTRKYIAQKPQVLQWCKSQGLKIREISFTVVTQKQDVGLHIDEPPITAKINIPIRNTAYTFNRWYSVPDHILQDPQYDHVNTFGKQYKDFLHVDLDQCKLIAEYELHKPIVFNSQIAHSVHIGEQAQLPRLVMSCMLFNDVSELLK